MHLSEREILIGSYKHAAYKACYWTEQSLRTGGRRQCYKHNFGIKSHQCIQSTSFRGCNIACTFCWRDIEERQYSFQKTDDPDEIAEQLVTTQQRLIEQHLPFALDNYENMIRVIFALGREARALSIPEISERASISRMRVKNSLNDLKNADVVLEVREAGAPTKFLLRKDLVGEASTSHESSQGIVERLVASKKDIIDVHLEAANPKHVAISYDGEPTMYERIGELIGEFRQRGLSTFVVTNGTFPERIIRLKDTGNLPTQLYVTLAAPDKETYLKVCSSARPFFPVNPDHWERLNKTLRILSTLDCRTVIRITSVRGVNMIKPQLYRQIVQNASPSFLEVKGFSITGNAPRISERLGRTTVGYKDPGLLKAALEYAPTHEEMIDFARKISDDFALFPLISQSELNRQVLMGVAWKDSSNVQIDFHSEL
ncbi:MAG TPA: radical SAM protein [Nitrososphaerales archaeon]|nr:radical SAM protein [Nitrososphaerales archaeon]